MKIDQNGIPERLWVRRTSANSATFVITDLQGSFRDLYVPEHEVDQIVESIAKKLNR